MQARCHLLNERIFLSEHQLDDARQAKETAQHLYQEADLLCPVCQQTIGLQADTIQILTCTHIFHQRYEQSISSSYHEHLSFRLDASPISYNDGLIKPNYVPNVIRVFYLVEVILHYHVLDHFNHMILFVLFSLLGEQLFKAIFMF